MIVSLKRGILLVLMALALLLGLLGWSLKTMTTPLQHSQHGHTTTYTHTLAYVCPPPPFSCW